MPVRIAVFLTGPPDIGCRVLEDVRRRYPGSECVAYYRLTDHYLLGAALEGLDAINDKPSGSKLAFVRDIRARRSDLAVVLWTGHHHYDRMKVVALLSGARRFRVYDEAGESFLLAGRGLLWVRHARWRPTWGNPDVPAAVALVLLAYKWTVGLLFGACWLLGRLWWRRLGRVMRSSAL